MIAIVAIDQANGIGRDGQLLQPLHQDLKRFKEITMGKVLIYGSKTLATFPGKKTLPGRLNLILSRRLQAEDVPSGEIMRSLDDLLARLEELKAAGRTEDDFCVIGGASVYQALLPYTHRVELTRIDQVYPADAYFPDLEAEGFIRQEQGPTLSEGDINFRYETWIRP
ncbi:MAG: dihydrofolate reductase [Eubacteriales bacterium]|nr:dihydrofolate reductase [Eubacteriales bacterium]